ncbi:hypothetical protein SESBI_36444 [Sesbania bispinosa]|nr:hypothetical protein SESBI_36444 [Sesbania bispinosa]
MTCNGNKKRERRCSTHCKPCAEKREPSSCPSIFAAEFSPLCPRSTLVQVYGARFCKS